MTPSPHLRQAPEPSLQEQALITLEAFKQADKPGVWPYLDKTKIVSEMAVRIKNPFAVNQGQQPFCGPASILFELILKQPLRYVEICRSLYENGQFQAQTQVIQASDHLRQASQGNLQMGPADWMVLATLRESENLIFPVEPNAPAMVRNLAGMTKSWEMKGWVKEILGYSNVDYYHTYVWRDIKALRQAQTILDGGGVALALITAKGLLSNEPPTLTVPNHWVALVGNVDVTEGPFWRRSRGHVSFDVFTWAKKTHIDVPQERFEDSFWGVVLGWHSGNS